MHDYEEKGFGGKLMCDILEQDLDEETAYIYGQRRPTSDEEDMFMERDAENDR